MDLTTFQENFFSKTKMFIEEHSHSTWTSFLNTKTLLHFNSKHISSHFELIFLMPSLGSTDFTLTCISSKYIKTREFHSILDQFMFLSDFTHSTQLSHPSFELKFFSSNFQFFSWSSLFWLSSQHSSSDIKPSPNLMKIGRHVP